MSLQDSNSTEQVLREHLLAAQVHSSPPQRSHALDDVRLQSPNQRIHNIDPAIAGTSMMSNSAGESGGDDNGSDNKKGGKRELSTSKRAAQNRAAQRAFRQRKEGHIRKLEEQVRDYNMLHESFKAIQQENYQLREYIINLQSRLIESQGDVPPLPSNINLQDPSRINIQEPSRINPIGLPDPMQHHVGAPTAAMTGSSMAGLQAGAQQAVSDRKYGHDFEMQNQKDAQLSVGGPNATSAAA